MRKKKILLFTLLLLVLTVVLFRFLDLPGFNFFNANNPPEQPEIPSEPASVNPPPEPEPEPDLRRVSLVAAGDIMAHLTQVEQASTDDGYDFGPSFSFIAPILQSADLTVGDLETVLAGQERGFSGYPAFNTPDELANNLKQAGFDLLATANNHSLDMGIKGLTRTLDCLTEAGLKYFGTYRSSEEKKPMVIEVNGIKIAFLSYTESTNGIPVPSGHEYAINYIPNFNTIEPIIDEISAAREKGADLVVLYMHWGNEYWFNPTDFHRDLARQLAIAGADLIIGGHPHVMQPMEWITIEKETGPPRQTLVAYSLGNFISNQFHWEPWIPTPKVQYGLLVKVEISKDMESGLTWVDQADYEITWVHRDWRHRILPLTEVLSSPQPEQYNLSPEEFKNVEAGFNSLRDEIVEKYGFSTVPVIRPEDN